MNYDSISIVFNGTQIKLLDCLSSDLACRHEVFDLNVKGWRKTLSLNINLLCQGSETGQHLTGWQ